MEGRRLSNAEHRSPAWRIGEIVPDFRLEDVWALPAQGGAGDFPRLLEAVASLNLAGDSPLPVRMLIRIRFVLGGWFGWHKPATRQLPVPGKTETTLASRLPTDLRGTATDLKILSGSFTPLFQTDDEYAAEISNGTVHAVLHLAWVGEGNGRYRGQMGIYVKPRGTLGAFYMALIKPFRYLLVYPALMRQIERAWNRTPPEP